MKLIRQTVLVYREGSSDKVYEVDLCEVGAGAFVVNFRYGRRGSRLKEGVKTVSPVPLQAAEKVFQDLVSSKTKKGYREVNIQAAETPAKRVVSGPTNREAQTRDIIDRLRGRADGRKQGWPLERVIWRAGELKLREAAPPLVELVGSGSPLRDYCIAWALGWCGDAESVSALGRLYASRSSADFVRRIAGEALLKLLGEGARAEFRLRLLEGLPEQLRGPAKDGPAGLFAAALRDYLGGGDYRRFAVLDALYFIDNEHVRPAVLDLLRRAPFGPDYFQRIRHVFKAAEYRHDAEAYGLIAYRFEKEKPMFGVTYSPLSGNPRWSYVSLPDGGYVREAHKEIKKEDAPIAYGARTRDFLRRRVWRTLRRLGELGDAEGYVRMAAGVLLPFTDADAHDVRESGVFQWQTGRTSTARWDAYAPYWAFNHILYANSPRYFHKEGTGAWRCRPSYKPGDPEPAEREEAFPELWERVPAGLLHLISESDCRPVQHFAVKALRACGQFCAGLDRDTLLMILGRPYEVTAHFGYELAGARYRAAEPDFELVLAVANSASSEARAAAHRWIDEGRELFLGDGDFTLALVTSPRADTREFARRLLRSTALPEEVARLLVVRLIAHLTGLEAARGAEAGDIAATLLACFAQQLRTLSLVAVLDLLTNPLAEVQELGGNILLSHEVRPSELPGEIIISLINSPHEPLRGIGVRLLGELPDESLLEREELLAALARHPLADLRNAVRPVIQRLSRQTAAADFTRRLAQRLLAALLAPETAEGVHRGVALLLREDLKGAWADEVEKDLALRLALAPGPEARELGGYVIETNARAKSDWAQSFTTDEIVELAGAEVFAVRQAARTLFDLLIDRYRQAANPGGHLDEIARAVRLLDTDWEDARAFFFEVFRTRLGAQDFTPGILVSVCDSVRPEVQQLGRELVTKYFSEEAGQEYMLKLSEHPSAELQLFVTNYLERYCAGDPQRLRELSHYFTSVLSRVNKARVAKARVIAFLTSEAQKGEEAARVVAGILTRQSVTVAVGMKASAIEAMLAIRRAHPDIPLPLDVKPAEVRRAV
ncbi:MAG TPA: HEAT repeat domain-containing protein [Pyrinomonadaceae bacterium]|nr:HEAT repeat domain-containing protein [Pyrinomonadaceae bacterium]